MVLNMGDEVSNTWTLGGHVKSIAVQKTGLRKRKIHQEKHEQVDFAWKWIETMSSMFYWPCFVPVQLCACVCVFMHDFNSDLWWGAFNLPPAHLLWVENVQRNSSQYQTVKERPGAWWEFRARSVTQCRLQDRKSLERATNWKRQITGARRQQGGGTLAFPLSF